MPNDEVFQGNPVKLEVNSRSVYHRQPTWTGTWKVGELVPIFATSSIMPGDQFKMSLRSAIRMLTPVWPTMDEAQITIEAYFVPHRLVLSRRSMSPTASDGNTSWAAIIGAQDSLLNVSNNNVEYKLPYVSIQKTDYLVGGLADCLYNSCPIEDNGYYNVNCLKYLAYASIWNEYFREPSLQSPVTYSVASDIGGGINSMLTTFYGWLDGSSAGYGNYAVGSKLPLLPVSRFHGYFGSALPWPQRNTTGVELPIGKSAPLAQGVPYSLTSLNGVVSPGVSFTSTGSNRGLIGNSSNGTGFIQNALYSVGGNPAYIEQAFDNGTVTQSKINGLNLYADLSHATAATVNQFRLAVQTQRWFEHLARSGNKYTDLIHGMFGVRNQDLMTRPEYLGGITAPISVFQVAATAGGSSSSSSSQSLGSTGAYSLTNLDEYLFDKSFTEHGTLMIVMCVRLDESFSQGVNAEDFRFAKFDFYWPEFANLGETPLAQKLIYVKGDGQDDELVFGYQEAWAEYRFFPSVVTGYARPSIQSSIGLITYANNFGAAPDLGGYLDARGQVAQLDRTLQVTSQTAGFQFFGQFAFPMEMIRPMPLYSIPGLVDHH